MIKTLDGDALRHEIINRGYAELEHGIEPERFDHLIDIYGNFTLDFPDPEPETMDAMLPATPDDPSTSHWLDHLDYSKDTQKEWHKYRTNVASPAKPDGYTNRSVQDDAVHQIRGIDIGEDPKQFYHWRPGHHSAIARNHERYEWGAIPREVSALTRAFSPIHKRAAELLIDVCKAIEDTHPEITKYITKDSLSNSPVRLLFYHPTDNPILGGAHADKANWGLQPAESHKGLMVYREDIDDYIMVERDETKAVLFPGLMHSGQDHGRYPNSEFQPTKHRIDNVDEINDGRSPIPERLKSVCARWSIVFFAGEIQFVDPGKAATHLH